MAKKKIEIVMRNCRRCGNRVAGLTKPIHSSQESFDKFSGICANCVTPEEHHEILWDQANGIVGKSLRRKA